MEVVRPHLLKVGKRELCLPLYFPSISSMKTALQPLEYLLILKSFVGLSNQFLISAFDLANLHNSEETKQTMNAAQIAGTTILMDSGNYESYWKSDQANWRQSDFQKILSTFPRDLAFCYDEQQPPSDVDDHIALVVSRFSEDQAVAGDCMLIPIIHGAAHMLPTLCTAIAESTGVTIIAVPERKLGDGIFERASSIENIRHELNKLGRYVILHLLGTGNPISIAIYAAMGADSFDGLEWCQTVVDHDSALLYHLSHSDFLATQTRWGLISLSFHARTLSHNLEFYAKWMQLLNKAIMDDKVINFCRVNFPSQIFEKCSTAFRWE